MMGRLAEKVLDLIYPSNIYCIYCKRPIDKRYPYSICPVCMRMIRWTSATNEDSMGLRASEYKAEYTCAGYGLVEKALIHDLKYNDKSYLASYFGELMYERIKEEQISVQAIVPVPMYKKKERRRGYNQASLLAGEVSKRMGVPFYPDILIRIKDTPPMSKLNRMMRKENVKDVFIVSNWVQNIYDKEILLIDDVITTGSTAEACSVALKKAGARQVYVLAFSGGKVINDEVG